MANKRVTFVIVEGPSDETALMLLLEKVFANDQVHVHVVHGDITTQRGVSAQNIVSKVCNCVKEYAASSHFRNTDFSQIIHIIDSDGAFIDDADITESKQAAGFTYSLTGITGPSKQKIIERNALKRSVLSRLISCDTVWNIPYRAFYMSCNLDHVLHGKLNSTDGEKRNDALWFASKYRSDLPGFIDFMCKSSFSVMGDYKESWKYLDEGRHSLERHSNLGICLVE